MQLFLRDWLSLPKKLGKMKIIKLLIIISKTLFCMKIIKLLTSF